MVVLLAGIGSAARELGARRWTSAAVLRIGCILTVIGLGTLGGIVATLGAITAAGLPLRWALPPMLAIPLVVAFAPFLPRDVELPVLDRESAVPWRPILLVGAALVAFYMVDTAATTWGPVYLHDLFGTSDRLLPFATLPYLVATLAARLGGDRLVLRVGAVRLLRIGGVLAALALAVVVLAPNAPTAVVGFFLLGTAVATIAPLSYSAAAVLAGGTGSPEARRARVDAVIARFNQFNYVGALLGAVLTGVAGAGSLRYGYVVPMVLVLAMVPLARHFAVIDRGLSASD